MNLSAKRIAYLITSRFIRFSLILLAKISHKLVDMIASQSFTVIGKGSRRNSNVTEVKHIRGLWRQMHSNSFPIIFDIGGNRGTYTDQLLKSFPNSHIYVFEPSLTCLEVLHKKFENFEQVTIVNKAVGNSNGEGTLYFDAPGSPMASFVKRDLNFLQIEFVRQESIQQITLDDFCESIGVTPVIIKIDVEGYELEVLSGALQTINKVKIIQFEFGGASRDANIYFKNFWDFFNEREFVLFRTSPIGLIKISKYNEYDECFIESNYMAVNINLMKVSHT